MLSSLSPPNDMAGNKKCWICHIANCTTSPIILDCQLPNSLLPPPLPTLSQLAIGGNDASFQAIFPKSLIYLVICQFLVLHIYRKWHMVVELVISAGITLDESLRSIHAFFG